MENLLFDRIKSASSSISYWRAYKPKFGIDQIIYAIQFRNRNSTDGDEIKIQKACFAVKDLKPKKSFEKKPEEKETKDEECTERRVLAACLRSLRCSLDSPRSRTEDTADCWQLLSASSGGCSSAAGVVSLNLFTFRRVLRSLGTSPIRFGWFARFE